MLDRAGTFSDMEWLRHKRFAEMNPDELEEARVNLLWTLDWRHRPAGDPSASPHRSGQQIDVRRTLQRVVARNGSHLNCRDADESKKARPLILLADVSGSMEVYSKLVLQLFHTDANVPDVKPSSSEHVSRITSQLRLRNVDQALGETLARVLDWAGERIGACLGDFNQSGVAESGTSKGAIVVVVSDSGCDQVTRRSSQGKCAGSGNDVIASSG